MAPVQTDTYEHDISGSRALFKLSLQELPAFPPVALQVLTLLDKPKASFAYAAELIGQDAAISAKVLQICNSALFEHRTPITSILHAIVIIGLSQIRNLICTIAIAAYARLDRMGAGEMAVRRCWRHNLATALIARRLAEDTDLDPQTAYLAGLLHEIGRLALLSVIPQFYGDVLEDAEEDNPALWEQEELLAGINHRSLGNLLSVEWNFPAELQRAIHRNPTSDECAVPLQDHQPVTCNELVGFSSATAHLMGFSAVGACRSANFGQIVAVLPEQLRGQLLKKKNQWCFEVASEVNAIEASLHC